jgi:UDP-N-acetylglucosamine--dolichyl-phosphate N-acetylglucosaminephosphotransferase
MEPILVVSLVVSFFMTLFFTPIWIKRAKTAGLTGKDVNKNSREEIAESGGIAVLFGFVFGILAYIALKTFYFKSTGSLISTFALLSTISIIAFIGIIDDILGWKIGLNKRTRMFFLIFASIPLIVINVGESNALGVELGLLYPLIIVPLGIVGASATFNFLAGYNGLEASQGIIILSALALVTWLNGNSWLSIIALCMVTSLLAFYIFNKYPARVFPGDVITYSIGALIAVIAILGNIERIAIFFFIPYILETILKVRGKLKKESFSRVNKDGSLEMPYDKFYGLEHISIYLIKKIKKNHKVYEKEIVWLINLFQLAIILLGFIFFRSAIFK